MFTILFVTLIMYDHKNRYILKDKFDEREMSVLTKYTVRQSGCVTEWGEYAWCTRKKRGEEECMHMDV